MLTSDVLVGAKSRPTTDPDYAFLHNVLIFSLLLLVILYISKTISFVFSD